MSGLFHFLNAGYPWFAECLGLFLIPFAHEDVAIFAGSLVIVEHRLPVSLALTSIYAGMVASDFLLYGLGALARRSTWIQGLLMRPKIEHIGNWLGTHAVSMVTLARFVPGLMFPTYIGCGLYRVSWPRFALTTTLTAAIYLPALLFLFTRFGTTILSGLGYWSWLLVLGVLTVSGINWVRKPNWSLLFRVSSFGMGALLRRAGGGFERPEAVSHRGLPALGQLRTKVALAERIPPVLFYIPIGAQWLWLAILNRSLSLPTLANPKIEVGGLWGELKSECLDMVGPCSRQWVADYTVLKRGHGEGAAKADLCRAREAMARAGLSFPLVAKPDIGWRGFGVQLIHDADQLARYIEAFPEDQTIILQRAIEWEGEAGVLYARLPGEPHGTIVSLTFRYFPYVIGDGKHTIRDLVLADQRAAWKSGDHFGFEDEHVGPADGELDRVPCPGETVRLSFIGSNRVGGLYRDAREHITTELVRRFDSISRSIPEFYYGRYDIRFKSTDSLRKGEDFQIIEVNGAGGKSINVWDPTMPLGQVYRELFAQQNLLFEIGAINRKRGFKPSGTLNVLLSQWRQHRLIRKYPPSS